MLKRNEVSRPLSREAWRLLDSSFERAMRKPDDVEARQNMLLGAHLAGAAIENSMLGAAHAAANPLTAKFGIVHGVAVGMMLPHVIRYNASGVGGNPYSDIELAAQHTRRADGGNARCGVASAPTGELCGHGGGHSPACRSRDE